MKIHSDIMLDTLRNHIPNFQDKLIVVWLEQAEKQFNAKLKLNLEGGLILKSNNSEKHIGSVYFGSCFFDCQVNMFYSFINYHYCFIDNGNFVANFNFQIDYKQPVFG